MGAVLQTGALLDDLAGSLRRLHTDHVDLYQIHAYDSVTPLEETLTAFDELVQAGKVRYVAASNYSAARLTEARRAQRGSQTVSR